MQFKDVIKTYKKQDKWTKYSIIVITIAILLRFTLAAISHPAGDACWHLSAARFIGTEFKIPLNEPLDRNEPFWPAPLFHISVAVVYAFFNLFSSSVAEFAMKFVSPLFGSLSLIFIFLIVKRLFNSKIAFLSTIFISFLPLHIYYSTISYTESALTFFVTASIYFAINNRIFASALFAGLASLTKFTGFFVVPVILYILCLNSKNLKTKSCTAGNKLFWNIVVFLVISIAISSVWFIRNYVVFGNPVWPFLQSLFGGPPVVLVAPSIFNLLSTDHLVTLYLEFFGVPNGNPALLFFLNSTFFKFALIIWLAATAIFLIPLITGLFKLDHKKYGAKVALVLFSFFLLSLLLYAYNTSLVYSRFLLPAIIFFSVLWAFGLDYLLRSKLLIKRQSIVFIVLFIICLAFVGSETIKTVVAAKEWNSLESGFSWLQKNTAQNQITYTTGQCLNFNAFRQGVSYDASTNFIKGDYIFASRNNFAPLPNGFDPSAKGLAMIYSDNVVLIYEKK